MFLNFTIVENNCILGKIGNSMMDAKCCCVEVSEVLFGRLCVEFGNFLLFLVVFCCGLLRRSLLSAFSFSTPLLGSAEWNEHKCAHDLVLFGCWVRLDRIR